MTKDRFFIGDFKAGLHLENPEHCDNVLVPFLKVVKNRPKNLALWVDGVSLTYRELWQAAAPIASSLQVITHHEKIQSIGIIADRSIMSFVSIIASLAAGIPYVPIHPKYPDKRQLSILERANCSILMADLANAGVIEKLLPNIGDPTSILWAGDGDLRESIEIPGWHKIIRAKDPMEKQPVIKDSEVACLLFTSGSTGEPKGISIRHSNIISYIKSVQKLYRPNEHDRFSQVFEQTFDLSLHDMFVAWSSGGSLFCVPDNERHAPGRFINRHSLTFWFSTPSTIALMQSAKLLNANSFPTLRFSLFCGEPLSRELAKKWMTTAPNSALENLYGPTETTIAITRTRITADLLGKIRNTVPIGLPFSGQIAGLCDPDNKFIEIKHGSQGELALAGSQITEGYWRDEQSTEAKFIAGPNEKKINFARWYKTGDRVVFHKEHGFIFLGRLDDQVKIRGYRIEISEIETVLRKVSKVSTIAVVLKPQTQIRSATIIAFTGKTKFSEAELKKLCRQFLPWYMIPQRIISVKKWPLNSSSKTDKKALFQLLQESID